MGHIHTKLTADFHDLCVNHSSHVICFCFRVDWGIEGVLTIYENKLMIVVLSGLWGSREYDASGINMLCNSVECCWWTCMLNDIGYS